MGSAHPFRLRGPRGATDARAGAPSTSAAAPDVPSPASSHARDLSDGGSSVTNRSGDRIELLEVVLDRGRRADADPEVTEIGVGLGVEHDVRRPDVPMGDAPADARTRARMPPVARWLLVAPGRAIPPFLERAKAAAPHVARDPGTPRPAPASSRRAERCAGAPTPRRPALPARTDERTHRRSTSR